MSCKHPSTHYKKWNGSNSAHYTIALFDTWILYGI